MLLSPLLRLLCVSLCCGDAVLLLSHSQDGEQQKTKATFTPQRDYESTATNRNVHKARSGSSGTSWHDAAAAAGEKRGVKGKQHNNAGTHLVQSGTSLSTVVESEVPNGARAPHQVPNGARAHQHHQHQHQHHAAALNSVARRGAPRAVRKTQHAKGPGGAGRAHDDEDGGGDGTVRGEVSAAMATKGRGGGGGGGCRHVKSNANYHHKGKKHEEQTCRRKKAARHKKRRQRRGVERGEGDGEAMREALPKPMAQEQGTYLPFNESADYEQFTLPSLFDFIPKNPNRRKMIRNPFYPVTAEAYGAYAVVIVAGIIFTTGILGNIAIMCIVCHNYYMRSISNSLLANLAFWDFVVVFFCLPLVTFHELTKNWLLGEFSCKVIPYLEVVSLGVTTFTLCALCIDRFRAATNVQMYYEMIENCASTGAKLAVIWVGALLLALPEILIRQLVVEDGEPAADAADTPPRQHERCVVRISTDLPDTLYVLGLTYDGARLWWYFGCYFCLPTLFTICCSLVTARRIRRAERAAVRGTKKQIRLESQMNCVVVALAILYGFCIIPENICNIVSVYMAASVPRRALDVLHLVSQLLLFCKSAATPVLLLCLCRPFSRAFLDCCCCCCQECSSGGGGGGAGGGAGGRGRGASASASDNENECTTTELELSPFSTIRRGETSSPYASVGTHC